MNNLPGNIGNRSLSFPYGRIFVLLAALLGAIFLSITLGATDTSAKDVLEALFSYDQENTSHRIIWRLRLPRTVLGLLVGASLSAAGTLMQALTRNPLADPGLFGVNAGAAFAVVLVLALTSIRSSFGLIWFAFLGAALASVAVYLLGSSNSSQPNPARLAVAGAALSILLISITRGITIIDHEILDQFRFWAVGSIDATTFSTVRQVLPFIVCGLVLSLVVSSSLDAVALGEETATSLDVDLVHIKILTAIAVTLLCGASVSAAGPIAFVGLVVPHAVRITIGSNLRLILRYCLLVGPTFLLLCDVAGRLAGNTGEIQVGVMTAAIGGPLFIHMVRSRRVAQV